MRMAQRRREFIEHLVAARDCLECSRAILDFSRRCIHRIRRRAPD